MTEEQMRNNLANVIKSILDLNNKSLEFSNLKKDLNNIWINVPYGLNNGRKFHYQQRVSWESKEEYLKGMKYLLELKKYIRENYRVN